MKTLISFAIRKIPRKHLQKFSHIGLKVISIIYRGDNVECPVCSSKFKKFLPYGRFISRENALCPSCLSLERHRLMWLYLKNRSNFFTDKLKVLHIAPEYCFIKRFKKLSNLNYYSADIESPLARVKLDVMDIPFDDKSFDVIFCNHVMEHVDNDIKAMKELHRVLKSGGWGIIQSPINIKRDKTYEDKNITDPREREKHFGQDDHQREYGLDYPERLTSAGFKVDVVDMISEMDAELVKRYALLTYKEMTAEDILYVVHKE